MRLTDWPPALNAPRYSFWTSSGEIFLDLAIALGAAPPRPARYPAGFAPNPRDEIAWITERLAETDLRTVAAFGTFLASRQARGAVSA